MRFAKYAEGVMNGRSLKLRPASRARDESYLRRTLPIPAFLLDVLAALLTAAPESEYVFCSAEGSFVNYSNFLKRHWRPAVEQAGLAPLTPHELRHTAAAIMIDQRANPVTVQRRLAHKDIATTLQLYGHLFPEQDHLLTERLDELHQRSIASTVRPAEVLELHVNESTSV